MYAVTMTAYRRPDYTRQVLDSLKECLGAHKWVFMPQIEPGCDEVVSIFEDFKESGPCDDVRMVVNRNRLGLNVNTHAAIQRAYAANINGLVHIEDDTVLSPDALEYFKWAFANLEDEKNCLLASGYNKPATQPHPEFDTHTVDRRAIFTPWGWGTTRSRIKWMLAHWNFANKKCFTCGFKRAYRKTRTEIYPWLSRVQNIGYVDGENERTPEWYEANHRTPWVAGQLPKRNFCFAT